MSSSKKKKFAAITAGCVLVGIIGMTLMGMMPAGGGGGGMGGGQRPSGGGMGGSGAAQGDQAAQQRTVINAGAPVLGSIEVTGSFVGTVEPGQQVTVYPKASGEVVEINYLVGDTVEADAVLFKLDSSTLELDIAQTRANIRVSQERAKLSLETARTNLENYVENAQEGLNSSLQQAENSVRSAENALQQANITYTSARKDYNEYIKEGWEGDYADSTRTTLRNAMMQAELRMESAQMALENAQTNLDIVRKQVEEQKVTAENNVKTAELGTDFTADTITLQKLMNNLENYSVKAPISGVIEQRNIELHNTVSTQVAAYVISNKDMVTVSFGVAESALAYLSPGNTVTVEKNGVTGTGVVTEVSTMVNSASGLYTVKASIKDAPFELHSGSAVKLRVVTQRAENVLLLPIDAVYYDNGSPHVFVFENNTARKAPVEVGISDSENIEIKSGISKTDQVILTWSARLYDGAEVYLVGDQEPTAQTQAGGTPSGDEAAPQMREGPPSGDGAAPANRP